MIFVDGMGALGDDSDGTTLPSSELLMASTYGTASAPDLAPQPPAADRILNSAARPPAAPGSLATLPSTSSPAFPPPTTGGEMVLGITLPTWLPKWAVYAGGLVLAAFVADYAYRKYARGGRRVVTNPKGRSRRSRRATLVGGDVDDRDLVERAEKFGEKFHWGIRGRKKRRAKVPKTPKVLTKLGEVVNITYKTKKRGEAAEHFIHEFGEEGGKRPTLGMDIENKKLHFVGGDYDVTADGIKD